VEPGAPQSEAHDHILPGIPASPGIAIGQVHILASNDPVVEERPLEPEEIDTEIARFRHAVERTRQDLLEIRRAVVAEVGDEHAKIFDAHLALLDDVMAIEATEHGVREQGRSAAAVFRDIVGEFVSKLSRMQHEYLRERVVDILDVERRVLRHLASEPIEGDAAAPVIEGDVVLVTRDLAPSEAAVLLRDAVRGFATDLGGRTSHTALLAQERGIPAVVGLRRLSIEAREGQRIVVDGTRGLVLLDPSAARLRYYQKKSEQFRSFQERFDQQRELPAVTRDGHALGLSANVTRADEVPQVIERGGEGIGLFRTEYLFIGRATLPGEDEQFASYDAVAAALAPRSVIIRTLDAGGDKVMGPLEARRQKNPVLGVRGIRLCQEHEPLFRTQVRAILRASARGNVKVMFPMITRMEEMRWAGEIVQEECRALQDAGIAVDAQMEVGAMIETPAAVLIAPLLAGVCDFFSIGSNDLTQYVLAVDRVNEQVAPLYDPLHPAVLLAIRATVDAARRRGIWVGLCGEMAVDHLALALLVGFGIDEISTSAAAIPKLKAMVRALSFRAAEEMAEQALDLDTAEAVRAFVSRELAGTFPEILA
jgi:phosphotransferase system enzyme I (PtsI)